MSVNQTESTQRGLNQASSQSSSRKRSRSGDPIFRSMDRFTNVLKEAMDKTNETLDKFSQVQEIAEVFKAQSNEDQKFQFIASILSGAFDG
ncbi:hypothetical protein JRO89_XS05G0247300 [Xanthoceras sorbifolium]|uniref:Uncharacterized protein n=1 Tax=Xanthoceras sorbifolium TaxID=99658 RepID=A0ABQ8I356_9ROSI|nr:hypothetical protein JRO89_XS05G0247300 [Xanthoceras sorbifolium]